MVEYVRSSNVREGDILARPLYGADGRILLASGKALTERGVTALRDAGYRGAYIEAEDGAEEREHIPPPEPLIQDEKQVRFAYVLESMLKVQLTHELKLMGLVAKIYTATSPG